MGSLMNDSHVYTPYHPRWLRHRVSTYWWLERPAYFRFILREGSCMFVAWFTVYLLMLLDSVRLGPAAYEDLVRWSASPWVLVVNVVTLGFLLFHAITFFQAAPQAMVLHVGQRRVPGRALLIGHYAAWAAASVVIYGLLIGV